MDYCKAPDLEIRNDRIIKAILEKEKAVCPGSVALIGIYGSFQTGDIHPLSDLDLLILINDERGWQLGTVFIQDDLGVGHDIYCTSWESLREDALLTGQLSDQLTVAHDQQAGAGTEQTGGTFWRGRLSESGK